MIQSEGGTKGIKVMERYYAMAKVIQAIGNKMHQGKEEAKG